MLTLQGVFDMGVSRILIQNIKSADITGMCYYRHPFNSNIKCVIGHLILDEYYDSKYEVSPVEDLPLSMLQNSRIPTTKKCRRLLRCLQAVHDDDIKDWPLNFIRVAKIFNLDSSIIEIILKTTRENEQSENLRRSSVVLTEKVAV